MARGTSLANLLVMLNAELGNSTAANPARDSELKTLLSTKQQWIASEYRWPFLERRWDVDVAPGSQFVEFPTMETDFGEACAVDLDHLPRVEVYWNNVYQPVQYGIGEDEYNIMDHALGQDSDPIQRWRMATNVNDLLSPNVLEVWPVPVGAQRVRITGQRALLPLTADTDTADLDDIMLIKFVAADKLMRLKQQDAPSKLAEAQRRLQWLKQGYPTQDRKINLAGGSSRTEFYKDRKIVGMTIVVK